MAPVWGWDSGHLVVLPALAQIQCFFLSKPQKLPDSFTHVQVEGDADPFCPRLLQELVTVSEGPSSMLSTASS